MVLNRLQLNYVSIWVRLHSLPLEYQYPELAKQMGHLIGFAERVDWEDRIPKNIRLMRVCVRVRLDLWMSIIYSFMLRLDDGSRTWI